MGKIKFGRVFGLSILGIVSMMAMFAVSAQAAEFWVKEKGNVLLATATGAQEGEGILLVPGRNLTLKCAAGDVKEGSEIKTASEGLAKILFLTCKAFSHKTGSAIPCEVLNPEATAIISPVVHEGLPYVLAKADGGTNFTTVVMHGELCPLPLESPVTGTLAAKVTTNGAVVDLIESSEAIQKLLGDVLKFGEFEAFVIAKATIELTGAHKGLNFGVA